MILSFVHSNKVYLAVSCVYLITLFHKLQNYRQALFLVFLTLLPFTRGKNFIDTTLLTKEQLYGYTLFDVQYFFPIFLSDVFLFLLYQSYLSSKINRIHFSSLPKSKTLLFALSSYVLFLTSTLLRTITHPFGNLIFFGSLEMLKFLLIFLVPFILINKKNNSNWHTQIIQVLAAHTFFQSVFIFLEQLKGGNLGLYIENVLPGLENGTNTAELQDVLRSNGTFNEANITAIFLLMNSLILLHYCWKKYGEKIFQKFSLEITIYLSIIFLGFLAIVLTGSRSLYLLSFLSLLFIAYQRRKHILAIAKKILSYKKTILLLLIPLFLLLPYFLVRLNSLSDILNPHGSLSYRLELNKAALSLGNKNLLGIGIDMTAYYLGILYKTPQSQTVIFDQAPAHNIFVQLYAETGILGLFFFCSFLYFSLSFVLKKKNNIFISGIIIYLLAAQIHPIFTNHLELASFFFLFLGLSVI